MTEPLRYTKAECKDEKKIELFLLKARNGNLGFFDGTYPYIIPMAYVWYKGAFYFHGSAEGKKNKVLKDRPQVCFTVSEDYGTTVAAVPANLSTAYMSVVVYGDLEEVHDFDIATEALNAMIEKYVPNYYEKPMKPEFLEKYRSSLGSRTVTWKLVPLHLTTKEHQADIMTMYFGGRNRQVDVSLGIK